MIELLDFIDARIDPSDPIHAAARDWVKRCRELLNRGEELRERAMQLLDADDIEGADAELKKIEAATDALQAIVEGQASVLAALRPSTETMQ